MGCAISLPLRITHTPSLMRTSIDSYNSLCTTVEKTIEKVNKINSVLAVAVDKFQTITGLHNPPHSLACGTMAMLACISAVVEGELLRLDFHLIEEIPGIGLNETILPPGLANIYLIWVSLAKEIETSLIEMQEVLPEFIAAKHQYKTIIENSREFTDRDSKIHRINEENLKESAEFFQEVLLRVTSYMKEITGIIKSLNRLEVVAEFIRLGEHANKLCIVWPEELTQTFGDSIERFVEKVINNN